MAVIFLWCKQQTTKTGHFLTQIFVFTVSYKGNKCAWFTFYFTLIFKLLLTDYE